MSTRVRLTAAITGVVIVLGFALAGCGDAGLDATDIADLPAPTISGDALPLMNEVGPDMAAGRPAPRVSGVTLDGSAIRIADDGRAKALVFLAHWCSHCRAEAPEIQEWLDNGGKPHHVDLYAVVTWSDERRPNYPPDAWFSRIGWSAPVLVDTDGAAHAAFGLQVVPSWVFVNSDGTVAERVAGRIPPALLTDRLQALR